MGLAPPRGTRLGSLAMGRAALLAMGLAVVLAAPASAGTKHGRDAQFPVRVTEKVVYGQGQVNKPAPG